MNRIYSCDSRRRGFTLIELLLVISIVIILAALVIVSVSKARARGRDAKRISDLSQIQLALEMYKDANGAYPITKTTTTTGNFGVKSSGCTACDTTAPINSWSTGSASLQTALQSDLFPLPKDPSDGKTFVQNNNEKTIDNYSYSYFGTATNYKLLTRLEEDLALMENDEGRYNISGTADDCYRKKLYEIFTLNGNWGCSYRMP